MARAGGTPRACPPGVEGRLSTVLGTRLRMFLGIRATCVMSRGSVHHARGCRTRRSGIGRGSSSLYGEGAPAAAGAPRRPDRRNMQQAPRCKAGAVVGSAGSGQAHHRDEVQHLGELDLDHLPMGVERCRRSAPDADRYGASPLQ